MVYDFHLIKILLLIFSVYLIFKKYLFVSYNYYNVFIKYFQIIFKKAFKTLYSCGSAGRCCPDIRRVLTLLSKLQCSLKIELFFVRVSLILFLIIINISFAEIVSSYPYYNQKQFKIRLKVLIVVYTSIS